MTDPRRARRFRGRARDAYRRRCAHRQIRDFEDRNACRECGALIVRSNWAIAQHCHSPPSAESQHGPGCSLRGTESCARVPA